MTFTSIFFLIGLLPWFILLLSIMRNSYKARKILIFLANTLFYIFGGIGSFIFLCCYSIVIWIFCLILRNQKNKLIYGAICLISVIPLLFIKYTGFAISNINSFLHYSIEVPDLLIPIGISFFTFEAFSCLCDVYTNTIKEKISFGDVYIYLSFFPTITSGPIMRFPSFKLGFRKPLNPARYDTAVERILIGLCKKVLIADKIAPLANYYFDGVALGNTYSVIGLWIGSVTYTLQIYFDFSGYSDMAIGIGQLMGFDIPENFNKPYTASSIQDFWGKWHITLSQWFRDYIYIPLGGNRCVLPRHILNLFIVWLITGLWHGANWSFVVWGMGYFVLLVCEKYLPFMKKISSRWYGHLYALFFINLLWIPFRANNLVVAGKYIAGMFGSNGIGLIENKAISFLPYLLFITILCFPCYKIFNRYTDKLWFKVMKGLIILLLTGLALCAIVSSSYTPYIYGNF